MLAGFLQGGNDDPQNGDQNQNSQQTQNQVDKNLIQAVARIDFILLIHNDINHTIITLNRTQNRCQIAEILQELRNGDVQLWYHIKGIN